MHIVQTLGSRSTFRLPDSSNLKADWRVATERIFRYILIPCSCPESSTGGNGVSVVLSDYQCNAHLTSGGCFERSVRLPAAIKGAKLAGASMSRIVEDNASACLRLQGVLGILIGATCK